MKTNRKKLITILRPAEAELKICIKIDYCTNCILIKKCKLKQILNKSQITMTLYNKLKFRDMIYDMSYVLKLIKIKSIKEKLK